MKRKIMESTMIPSAHFQVAEIELIYKTKVKASARPQILVPDDAYNVLKQSWDDNKIDLLEQFKVILLNRANRVLAVYEVSSGGITGTFADVRLILVSALKLAAVSIIIAHNHPSGNLLPSRADVELTNQMKQACSFHEIMLRDHLIVTSETYFSFADEGLL